MPLPSSEMPFAEVAAFVEQWESQWGPYPKHPALQVDPTRFKEAWAAYTKRLMGNYPFFHPRYAGQMLKPPHPVAIMGYLAAMHINPNNHALDGGPPTGQMEKELVKDLAALFHFPDDTLGHLTSSGTIANLEALWVARHCHPGKKIAFSAEAHYTHSRMCEVIGVDTVTVPVDTNGRIDLNALETALQTGEIGTVVMTAGTTGIGAVDRIDEALVLRARYGCRIHVDAAYGGFFALHAWANDDRVPVAPFQAIAGCDSVVVDPHKQGLQPYGCGAVLFRDPSAGRYYKHDSPYTYFTSDELHLGEISLECSRAGAAAGALWLTLQCLPLEAETGLGAVLGANLDATRDWTGRIAGTDELTLYLKPELDILCCFPNVPDGNLSAIDAASARVFKDLMDDPEDPVFLSVLRRSAADFKQRFPNLTSDVPFARVLRSAVMKPAHALYVGHLHQRVVEATRVTLSNA